MHIPTVWNHLKFWEVRITSATFNVIFFTMVQVYHRHKSTPEFQRRISYVYDSSGQLVAYAVM